MRLYAVVPRREVEIVRADGIRRECKGGRLHAVMLFERNWVDWAKRDCQRRTGAAEVAVLYVSVRRYAVRQTLQGLWYTTSDVPARAILGEFVLAQTGG